MAGISQDGIFVAKIHGMFLRLLKAQIRIHMNQEETRPARRILVNDGLDLGRVAVGNRTIIGDEDHHVGLHSGEIQRLLRAPIKIHQRQITRGGRNTGSQGEKCREANGRCKQSQDL